MLRAKILPFEVLISEPDIFFLDRMAGTREVNDICWGLVDEVLVVAGAEGSLEEEEEAPWGSAK